MTFAWPERKQYPCHDKASAQASVKALGANTKLSAGQRSRIQAKLDDAARKFDLAPTDVHAPALAKPMRISVRGSLGEGGSIHVRHHMTNETGGVYLLEGARDGETVYCLEHIAIEQGEEVPPESVGVTLQGPDTYSDGKRVTLRWVMLAMPGAWKGHASGPFALTEQTFAEIKANFEKRNIPVMFDLNHISESDPTEGTLRPEDRAKAWGWTHKLKVDKGKLWGLVEWLDTTRTMIAKGELKYVSPAFALASRDQTTGLQAGARLKSAAVTNNPFLSHMPGLIAATNVTHSNSHEFMPQVRACLKCDDTFDHVQSMIDSAIAEHEAATGVTPRHGVGGDAKLDDDANGEDEDTEMCMKTIAELTVEVDTLTLKLSNAEGALAGARAEVVTLTEKVAKGDAALERLLTLEKAAVIKDVDEAIVSHNIAPEKRAHMLTFREGHPEAFASMYPAKTPRERVMSSNITKSGERTAGDTVRLTNEGGGGHADSASGVTIRWDEDPLSVTDKVLKAHPHLSFGNAQIEAQRLLTAAERAHDARQQ